jgi:hypothetical protein
MTEKTADGQYGPEEAKRRMEESLRRALSTPPKPHKEMIGSGKRARSSRKAGVKKSGR